jgi:hypothetical protein
MATGLDGGPNNQSSNGPAWLAVGIVSIAARLQAINTQRILLANMTFNSNDSC